MNYNETKNTIRDSVKSSQENVDLVEDTNVEELILPEADKPSETAFTNKVSEIKDSITNSKDDDLDEMMNHTDGSVVDMGRHALTDINTMSSILSSSEELEVDPNVLEDLVEKIIYAVADLRDRQIGKFGKG